MEAFKYIINPSTNKKYSISSAQGKKLISNYINNSQRGGSSQKTENKNKDTTTTVLGDKIIGWNTEGKGFQLHRCPKHKKYEANLLLKIPKNSSFLDIGSHYGDTVLTMALHAKNNNRSDIRFYSFDPNSEKCKYIEKISKLNGLNVQVFNNGVGNINSKIEADGQKQEKTGACSYKKSNKGDITMIKLDDVKHILEPIGFMHIDVEGWESRVLKGASSILKNNKNKMFVIAECWSTRDSIKRGFSQNPEQDIVDEMSKYKFTRQKDLYDMEKNLVFFPQK